MSKIQWTDTTWNPVRGCSLVSAGCANCYAMKQAHRFSGKGKPYEGLTELGPQGPRWTGNITLVHEALEQPLHWKQPRRIFVNSMSDLFHENVPDKFIDRVMQVMANTNRHTYQVLTKRPERMKSYLSSFWNRCYRSWETGESIPVPPCKHIWFGVSVEDQETADERIPILLQTPAAVRFISIEPLLGPIDLNSACWGAGKARPSVDLMARQYQAGSCSALDWVILGGESGPRARPCDIAWIRSIKEQCQLAAVPVFIKQIGSRPGIGHPTNYTINAEGAVAVGEYGCGRVILPLAKPKDKKGGDMAEWHEDLRVREFP